MNQKKKILIKSSTAHLMTLKNLKTTMSKPVIYSKILKTNSLLPSQQKACGLFNPNVEIDKNDADGTGTLDDFINTNIDQKNEKSKNYLNEELISSGIDNAAIKTNSTSDEIEFSLNLENEKLDDLLSPNRSQLQECIQDMASFDFNLSDYSKDESTANNNSDFMLFDIVEQDQKQDHQVINNDPFLGQLVHDQNNQSIEVEHLYASKRHLDEEEVTTPFEDSDKSNKKQRTKGIYRAKDVKSAQDLENYIERRLKNNKSSKISRSNKKHHYLQMDQQSEQLEKDNQLLKAKIEILTTKISTLKSFLISNLSSS